MPRTFADGTPYVDENGKPVVDDIEYVFKGEGLLYVLRNKFTQQTPVYDYDDSETIVGIYHNPTTNKDENLYKAKVNDTDLITTKYEYDTEVGKMIAYYQENQPKYAADAITAVKDNIVVKVDGHVDEDDLTDSIVYSWQVLDKESGKYVDMTAGDAPHAVGEYRLMASIKAQVGKCADAESAVLDLEVKKADLNVVADVSTITPGDTVAKIKAKFASVGFEFNDSTEELEQALYADKVEVKVEKAYDPEKKALADTDVLFRNEDYRLVFTVTLKDNAKEKFVVGKSDFIIHFREPVPTKIDITYTSSGTNTPGKEIAKVYDGKAIDFDALVKPEYSAKVLCAEWEKVWDSTTNKYVEKYGDAKNVLEGATINGAWCDADKVAYAADFVPEDAGVYYYKLSYSDETGTYVESSEYIKVEIKMASIVIVPKLNPAEAYVNQSVSSVLKQVAYDVYKIVDDKKATTAEILDEYYWGVAYNVDDKGRTQSYEPVFAIQRAVKKAMDEKKPDVFTVAGWETLASNDVLRKNHEVNIKDSDGKDQTVVVEDEYRVVFAGKKTVYPVNSTVEEDINASQKNYKVEWSDAAIEKYGLAVALKLNDSTAVAIDVTAILESGNGADFDNPIVKAYTGNDLYKTKDLYKKAVVKAGSDTIAQNSDSSLTYIWEKANFWLLEDVVDKDGNILKKWAVKEWVVDTDLKGNNYNNVEVQSSPRETGVYRLRIEYKDGSKKYQDAVQYVYYTIKPQDAIAVLTGAPNEDGTYANPASYADGVTNVNDFLRTIQHYIPEKDDAEADNYVINKDTFVDLVFYPVTVSEDAAGKVTVTKGSDPLTDIDISSFYTYPTTYFCVERLITEGKDAGKWTECGANYVLKKDDTYRINVHGYAGSYINYNFGNKLDNHNQVEKEKYFENETLALSLKDTEGIELQIEVEEDLIVGNVKVYDGKPFDIKNLKDIVKVRTKKDGKDVTADVKDMLTYTFVGNTGFYWSSDAESAIHANNYTVTIALPTNDKYQKTTFVVPKKYVILSKEIVVKPVLVDSIKAGYHNHNYNSAKNDWADTLLGFNNHTDFAIETALAEGDENVLAAVYFDVQDTEGNKYEEATLRSSKTYYVKGYKCEWNYKDLNGNRVNYYDYDYQAKFASVSFKPVRVAGNVTKFSSDGRMSVDNELLTVLKDTVEAKDGSFIHTITAMEGIPFFYGNEFDAYDKDKKIVSSLKPGNYILFNVYRPKEFNGDNGFNKANDYVFANSIERAGGYFVDLDKFDGDDDYDCDSEYISLAFDVSALGKPSFDIIWENGYTETYILDLDQMQDYLEEDLTKAVAPKSLSFNGAPTKMAVGETRQLDVKMTKTQMSDIICLGYSSSDESVLKVTEDGLVTALKASKAAVTIEVYPCRVVNGVKERITDKGTKSAKVKIKVSEVAVPKISKVTPRDTYAEFSYIVPANGYRREVYVMKDSKKAADFEAAIADVKNGDFSAFVDTKFDVIEDIAEPVKKNIIKPIILNNLAPNSTYTVYVRNVSGLRVLADGSQIAMSATGSVKTFKTTLSQIKGVKVYFDPEMKGQTVKVEKRDGIDMNVAYLKDKSAKVSVDVKLWEYYSKGYSDFYADIAGTDYIWRTLPMEKNFKNSYYTPKISYYVSEVAPQFTKSAADSAFGVGKWVRIATNKLYDAEGYGISVPNYCDGYYYFSKTASIAKIDKKGKISFKGKGYLYVIAQDSVTGLASVVRLFIDASPNSMTAKAVKFVPGQSVALRDALEYKEGKTKIVNYTKWHYNTYRRYNELYVKLSTAEATDDNYQIERTNSDCDYAVTALKAAIGKSKVERRVEVEDAVVKENGGKTAVVKLSTAAVQPVKTLKVSQVFDDAFRFTFSYPKGEYDFRLVLKDGRGKIIRNEIVHMYARDSVVKSKKVNYLYEWGYTDDTLANDGRYSGYTKTDLTRLSNYTVTVTAVCNGQVSKDTKLKVKTTNVPLSYTEVSSLSEEGGDTINIKTEDGTGKSYFSYLGWSSHPVLKTGNIYTLELGNTVNKEIASTRATDTLKWKSSDPKVATVKAKTNKSASLKAVRQGETTIEVTSKLTKKVIAKWIVTVGATGDAGSYFGDNEPYRGEDGADLDAIDAGALKITMGAPISVKVHKGEIKKLVFIAPAAGRYEISANNSKVNVTNSKIKKDTPYELEKNAKWKIEVNNQYGMKDYTATIEIKGILFDDVYVGNTNTVKTGGKLHFVAPETNYYIFTRVDNAEQNEDYVRYNLMSNSYNDSVKGISLKAGDVYIYEGPDYDNDGNPEGDGLPGTNGREYTIEISKRDMVSTLPLKANIFDKTTKPVEVSLTKTKDKNSEVKWYSFTAEETNLYTFSFTDIENGALKAIYYTDLSEASDPVEPTDPLDPNYSTDLDKYQKSVKSATGDLTVKIHDDTVVKDEDSRRTDNHMEFSDMKIEKGNTVYFKLVCTPEHEAIAEIPEEQQAAHDKKSSCPGVPVKGKVIVTKREYVTSLTDGVKATVKLRDKDAPVWCDFTADENGYYTISTASNITTAITAKQYPELTTTDASKISDITAHKTGDNNNIYNEIYLKAGVKVYFALSIGTTLADAVDVDVTVKKRSAEKLTLGTPVESSLGKEDVKWYEFVADEFNLYTFYSTYAKNTDAAKKTSITVKLYDTLMANDGQKDDGTPDYTKDECWSVADNDWKPERVKSDVTVEFAERQFNARGKIYLRVERPYDGSSTDDAVKPLLNVRKRDSVTTITDKETISLENGDVKWYKIAATEKNYYTVCVTGAEDSAGDVKVEFFSSLNDTNTPTDVVVGAKGEAYKNLDLLAKDEVRYIRVTTTANTSAKKATVSVKLRKRDVEADALKTDDKGVSVSLKANDEKWYKFTAAEDNIYSIEGENVQKGSLTVEFYDELLGSAVEFFDDDDNSLGKAFPSSVPAGETAGKVKIPDTAIEKGYTKYVKLTATPSGADPVTATIKVKARVAQSEVLPIGGNGITGITLKNGEEKWYSFIADEKNCYTFYSDNVADGIVKAEYFDTLGAKVSTKDIATSSGDKLNLTANLTPVKEIYIPNTGKKVYVRLIGSGAATDGAVKLTLKAKKRVLENEKLGLGDTGTPVSVKKGEEKWYAFTADTDNSYTFYADNVDKGSLSIWYYDGCRQNDDDYDDHGYWHVNHFDGSYGFNQRIEINNYYDKADSAQEKPTDEKQKVTSNEMSIKKGQTVYIRVTNVVPTDGKAETVVTMNLKVKKRIVESEALSLTANTDVSFAATGTKYYKFTAPEDNLYTFYSDNVKNGSITAYYSETLDESWEDYASTADEKFALKSVPVKEGETIYVWLNASVPSTSAVTATVKVKKVDPQKISAGAAAASLEFADTEASWFVFDPDESESYVFTLEDLTGYMYVEYYTDLTESSEEDDDGNTKLEIARKYIQAHKKVYLKVWSDSASSTSKVTAKLSVKNLVAPENRVTLGNGGTKDIEVATMKPADIKWYAIKANESGYYTISAEMVSGSGKRTLTFYRKDGYKLKDQEGTSTVSAYSRYIERGETLYFSVKANVAEVEDEKDAAKTKVTVKRKYEYESRTVLKGRGGEESLFFTAPEDGTYYFFTKAVKNDSQPSGYYTRGTLIGISAGYGNTTTTDGYSYEMSRSLLQGERVEFKVSDYTGNGFITEMHITNFSYSE